MYNSTLVPMYKRGSTWWCDLRGQGGKRTSTGCTDRVKAEAVAVRMVQGRTTCHTLEDTLMMAWGVRYQMSKGSRNVASQMGVLVRDYGSTRLLDIDTPWMVRFVDNMKLAGRSGPTVNRYLALMQGSMKIALMRGWIDQLPMFPREKEQPGRIRVLSPVEEGLMLTCLTHAMVGAKWMGNLTAFLLDTGARLGEALALDEKSAQAAADAGRWTIWNGKSGRPRTIPLTGRAIAVLKDGGWFDKSPAMCRTAWNRARELTGMGSDKSLIIHALRHTCATRLVNAGVDMPIIRDWLGHSSVKVTERYAHLNPANLDAALQVLEGDGESELCNLGAKREM